MLEDDVAQKGSTVFLHESGWLFDKMDFDMLSDVQLNSL